MKRIDVVIAIIQRENQVLICRRLAENHLGGFWEFPGGKVEPGETLEQCLMREVNEEVNLAVDQLSPLDVIEHDYVDRKVKLHPYLCQYQGGELKALGCEQAKWIEPGSLRDVEFPPANKALIEYLMKTL